LQDSINLSLWRGWENVHGVRFFQRLKGGKTIAIENWFHDPTLKNDKVYCYRNNVLQCWGVFFMFYLHKCEDWKNICIQNMIKYHCSICEPGKVEQKKKHPICYNLSCAQSSPPHDWLWRLQGVFPNFKGQDLASKTWSRLKKVDHGKGYAHCCLMGHQRSCVKNWIHINGLLWSDHHSQPKLVHVIIKIRGFSSSPS